MARPVFSIAILISLLFLSPPSVWCDTAGGQIDYTDLSIEELMDIEVTSVSRRPEKLSVAPAAVYVITQEDIRRSGATSIPELLRMVPGVQVASIDASKWAVTARGFNGRFANKLLVLVDGRSVYTPLYSGVFWDAQDVLLADVDRIEVIRGPGATMWGENAVNGVINVITKSARDTQGGLVMTGGGKEEIGFGGFRYGGSIHDRIYWRGFAKYSAWDKRTFGSGEEAADDWPPSATAFIWHRKTALWPL
jgi:iron complex outermembrane receptor protein